MKSSPGRKAQRTCFVVHVPGDYAAIIKKVEEFLTELGPERVISVMESDGYSYKFVVWYWVVFDDEKTEGK
jgi:hypothetical protein